MRRRSAPLRIAVVLLWSVGVWAALWSQLTYANVLWGLVVGAVTVLLAPPAVRRHTVVPRPLRVLHLAASFAWALVRASAVVAWEVVTPGSRINQGIVAAPLRTRSPGVITLIANMISLTPGTLTLEVREQPPTLYVHVLHLRTIEQVRADIRRLEDLALSALPVHDLDTEEPP